MTPVIQAADLRFRYPASLFAFSLRELAVPPRARVAITGRSGCGKTTLIKLIAGLLTPEAGELRVLGESPASLTDAQRRAFRIAKIGFIAQELDLLDHLRVEENILLPYYVNRALRLTAEARRRARGLASELGLADKLRRFPGQLSQGERQRVAVARALVTRPELLIADEPTGNLDGQTARQVLAMIGGFLEQSEATFLMITHDLSLLDFFGQRVDL